MEMYASCDCGWSLRGAEAEVHRALRDHGVAVHGIELTDDQLRAVSRPVAADDSQTQEDQ